MTPWFLGWARDGGIVKLKTTRLNLNNDGDLDGRIKCAESNLQFNVVLIMPSAYCLVNWSPVDRRDWTSIRKDMASGLEDGNSPADWVSAYMLYGQRVILTPGLCSPKSFCSFSSLRRGCRRRRRIHGDVEMGFRGNENVILKAMLVVSRTASEVDEPDTTYDLNRQKCCALRLYARRQRTGLERNSVSCIVAGSTNVIAGTPDGIIHLLDPTFKSVRSWKAHATGNVTHAKEVPETSYLITIAEDLAQEPELKVWSLDQLEKKTGYPKCLCTIPVQNGRENFPVTAFSVTGDLTQVAVGFGNGAVTVVRGDFIHDRGTKQRTVFRSEEPVTGMEFREANTTTLYIGTTSRVLALAISGKAKGTAARTLDENGCAVGCMTMNSSSNEIVVARDDAIYTYGPRGKGISYPYDCTKKLLGLFKDYVLLGSPPNDNLARNSLHAFGGIQATEIASNSTFTILNTNFKFIAHTELVSSQIQTFFSLWGDIFLLSIDGKIFRYREKTFQQKLEILYKRNQYLLAIDLAREYKVDAVQQNIIYRKFGDYLYQKGDYDTAMQQYLHAIDNTEPSQIIRKFLDNQRIRNLIEYLEELHEHHKATSDHTTLLLNCYAKLKDVEKLESFIKQPGDLKFDLDTAIVMCRQGGYYDQAAFLARRHVEHGLVVDILVEDLKKYAEALAYIVRLEPADAYASLMKYGTVLLAHCSQDATQLFIDYFTGQFRPKKDAVIVQEVPIASESSGFGSVARSAVQNLAALIPLPNMSTTLMQSSATATQPIQSQVVETTTEGELVEYAVPKPRVAFSSFIDHPECFIIFLEACIASSDVETTDKADLYTTLFEIYLQRASASRSEEKTEWERKAKSLIESKNVPIDTSNVLLLSDLEKFREGTILVSERQGLLFDVFRSYTTAHDTASAIRALKKYGPEEPQLYPAALAYFTSSPKVLEEAGDEVDAVLKKIDEDALMAPLQVIQCLSTNSVATMGLVKKYLSSTVERERAEIAANRKVISSYRHDTAQKLQEVSELDTKPTSFSATRCSTCAMALDLPTVHFLCKHSFHQRCLNIADGQEVEEIECPICAPQNQTVRRIQQLQEERAGQHELFLNDLNSSQDRFGTIGDWVLQPHGFNTPVKLTYSELDLEFDCTYGRIVHMPSFPAISPPSDSYAISQKTEAKARRTPRVM
nr:vacuolar protein sorting-associated protein 11 like [Quercus suber]